MLLVLITFNATGSIATFFALAALSGGVGGDKWKPAVPRCLYIIVSLLTENRIVIPLPNK